MFQLPESRNCARCGNSFKPNSLAHRFCSKECKMGKATCKVCGKEFTKKASTTGDYCSSECWYNFYDSQNEANCEFCKKPFSKSKSSQKYCSTECRGNGIRSKNRQKNCLRCGKEISLTSHTRVKYCSKSCAALGNTWGTGLSKPIGDKRKTDDGYVLLKVGRDHPSCDNRGWLLEHRYVMEQHLGRTLTKDEFVHHKNGQRDDNRIENLELWSASRNGSNKDPFGQRVRDLVVNEIGCGFASVASDLDENVIISAIESLKDILEKRKAA